MPFLLALIVAAPALAQQEVVRWPGRAAVDLQSVIDAAPDGATIRIAPGVHTLTRPLFLSGRRLTLEGAHWERGRPTPSSRLVGPLPQPVIDARGMALPAESVVGLVNFAGGELQVHDLRLSGFDAGFAIRDPERGGGGRVSLERVYIDGTGRGVLSQSSAAVSATDVTVVSPLWHGYSIAPSPVLKVPGAFFLFGGHVLAAGGAGIFIKGGIFDIHQCDVIEAKSGGLVAIDAYSSSVADQCLLMGNQMAGVAIQNTTSDPDSAAIVLSNNEIQFTQPLPQDQSLGDGVVVWTEDPQHRAFVWVTDNTIEGSKRAAVSSFGSDVSLQGNVMLCQAFDLDGEQHAGLDYAFHDYGSNGCGCPGIEGACKADSSMLSPPQPVGGLQN